jgi:hypothetical protein
MDGNLMNTNAGTILVASTGSSHNKRRASSQQSAKVQFVFVKNRRIRISFH